MPTGHRTRRAGGARRKAVLDAVAVVLAERGFESARFADVSAASGVAISTLQNYFGSREDMLIEAIRQSLDQEVGALETVMDAKGNPWNRLVALIDRSLDSSESTRRMLIEFWRAGLRDEELRGYSEEVLGRYKEPFLRAVTEGRDNGTFTLAYSPDEVVDFLLAALAGTMIPRALRHSHPSTEAFRGILLSQTRQTLGLT